MQAGMGITDGIIQGKISCFRNKFHKHKEKCSEKRKFLGALCLRSETPDIYFRGFVFSCICYLTLTFNFKTLVFPLFKVTVTRMDAVPFLFDFMVPFLFTDAIFLLLL